MLKKKFNKAHFMQICKPCFEITFTGHMNQMCMLYSPGSVMMPTEVDQFLITKLNKLFFPYFFPHSGLKCSIAIQDFYSGSRTKVKNYKNNVQDFKNLILEA